MTEKTLSGRVAIITGASQGLGREISKRIVAAGANVMLCARNYGLLEETEQELNSLLVENQKIFIKRCDVSNQEEVNSLVNETFEKLCGCQILVNNAGIYGPKGTVENQDWDDWKKAIDSGTSMHTILAEKKIAEGPEWLKTPEEEEILWEVRKFAIEKFGKTKWSQTESKQQIDTISFVLDQMINNGMDLQKEEILEMIWEKINEANEPI